MTIENHFNLLPLDELLDEFRPVKVGEPNYSITKKIRLKIAALKLKYANIYPDYYVVSDGINFYNYFICLGDPLITKCQNESKAIVYNLHEAESLLKFLNKRKRRVNVKYSIIKYNNLNNEL